MIIDLPPTDVDCFVYTMDDYNDLFVVNDSQNFKHLPPAAVSSILDGALSDPESGICTTSESDVDATTSHYPTRAARVQNTHTHALLTGRDLDLALHSPGRLLGTPRDPSRKFEYPFPQPSSPSPLNALSLASTSSASPTHLSSTSTIPGLSPSISTSTSSSSLGLSHTGAAAAFSVSLPSKRVLSLHCIQTQDGTPSTSASVSVASSLGTATKVGSGTGVAPSPTLARTHPKLRSFNPADAPVPPKLRARTDENANASANTATSKRRKTFGTSVLPPETEAAIAGATGPVGVGDP